MCENTDSVDLVVLVILGCGGFGDSGVTGCVKTDIPWDTLCGTPANTHVFSLLKHGVISHVHKRGVKTCRSCDVPFWCFGMSPDVSILVFLVKSHYRGCVPGVQIRVILHVNSNVFSHLGRYFDNTRIW